MTRYELLDRIGVGGMAEIFRGKAIAAGGFEKPVAIKRILPHLSQDKRFVELLIAEAKVLSLLKHRNIVQIFDVGLGDDGQYFLVMEYVDGKDLRAVQRGLDARRRRLPFDLALHLAAEICEALEHAHTARAPDGKPMSLVHRDVSPSNVLLSRAGETKLTDFGIAKRAEEATGHGAVRGKFAYISPEQARNEHLDPRSDVFAVGVLLWELVTGRPLFSALPDLEALRAVREAQVPRPRDLDGQLSPEIDALIMATLDRDPRGRPNAGQLGARLRSLRYSLDVTVGDPATELAKVIDAAEEVERGASAARPVPQARAEFDGSEATVIRIQTADAFSMRDKDGAGVARARAVIDRFDEAETRQARLSHEQLALLRANAPRDSGEHTQAAEPPLPGVRPQRLTDEQTRARPPFALEDAPTYLPDTLEPSPHLEPNQHLEPDEATRLVAPVIRRTPMPERTPPPELTPLTPVSQPIAPPAPRHALDPHAAPVADTDPGTARRHGGTAPHPPPPGAYTPSPLPLPPALPANLGRNLAPTPTPLAATSLAPAPPLLPRPPMAPPPMVPAPMAPPPMVPAPMAPPPMFPAPGLAPPQAPPPMPQGNFPSWATLPQAPPPIVPTQPAGPPLPYDRAPHRALGPGGRRRRRAPTVPWMLAVGALIMALLAFAVTRACISSATRPAATGR